MIQKDGRLLNNNESIKFRFDLPSTNYKKRRGCNKNRKEKGVEVNG